MKIIFNQAESRGSLFLEGIESCYAKRLVIEEDKDRISVKAHHHTGYEVHFVTDGAQSYAIGDKTVRVGAGEFLLIPPDVRHTATLADGGTKKYSLSFKMSSELTGFCEKALAVAHKDTPIKILELFSEIVNENLHNKPISRKIVENKLLEIIVILFRECGCAEIVSSSSDMGEDIRLSLAKQYISDNFSGPPTVSEVAGYIAISPKQLERLFFKYEGVSPLAYINTIRASKLEEMVANGELSFKEISSAMGFSSENYFNAFFKKHVGITPGAYKKMT